MKNTCAGNAVRTGGGVTVSRREQNNVLRTGGGVRLERHEWRNKAFRIVGAARLSGVRTGAEKTLSGLVAG